MHLLLLKSKIHQATVTGVDMNYEGSIVIDAALMEEVGLLRYEKVLVANMNTGDRFETYAIPGPARSGRIELNGATARLGQVGDRVIVFSFAQVSETDARTHIPRIVLLDEENHVIRRSFVA
jgi:aspartate 1-decarboxylase